MIKKHECYDCLFFSKFKSNGVVICGELYFLDVTRGDRKEGRFVKIFVDKLAVFFCFSSEYVDVVEPAIF